MAKLKRQMKVYGQLMTAQNGWYQFDGDNWYVVSGWLGESPAKGSDYEVITAVGRLMDDEDSSPFKAEDGAFRIVMPDGATVTFDNTPKDITTLNLIFTLEG